MGLTARIWSQSIPISPSTRQGKVSLWGLFGRTDPVIGSSSTPGGRGVSTWNGSKHQAGSLIPDFSAISRMSLDYRYMDVYGLYHMEY